MMTNTARTKSKADEVNALSSHSSFTHNSRWRHTDDVTDKDYQYYLNVFNAFSHCKHYLKVNKGAFVELW